MRIKRINFSRVIKIVYGVKFLRGKGRPFGIAYKMPVSMFFAPKFLEF